MSTPLYNGPLMRWLQDFLKYEVQPDPWPEELDRKIRSKSATPICLNCLHPQPHHHWFCADCGFPSGEYVTHMPFLYLLALGECFRRGVTGPPEPKLLRTVGFITISIQYYHLFAPCYWYWMAGKSLGKPICEARKPELKFENDFAANTPSDIP